MPDNGAHEHPNEPVALRRARFVVAYDGSRFHGFAPNRGVDTVVGVLTDALSKVTRHRVDLVGAGRTDAGVHAWGQVVSCDIPSGVDLNELMRHVNRMCGPEVVLRRGDWVSDEFSARFSAIWRHYRYTVLNGPTPHPFLASTTWHVPRPLLLPAMQLACDPLIGEHDFSSFCRKPQAVDAQRISSMKRRVMLARWTDVTDQTDLHDADFVDTDADVARVLRFEIRANAFCHQMVRSIVGTHIAVGRGQLHAGDIRSLMLARDRQPTAAVAPAHGLMLWQVAYADDRSR